MTSNLRYTASANITIFQRKIMKSFEMMRVNLCGRFKRNVLSTIPTGRYEVSIPFESFSLCAS